MRCGKARRVMGLIREGELDAVTMRDLLHHVNGCRRCAADYAQLEAMERTFERLRHVVPTVPGAPMIADAVIRRLDAERSIRRQSRPVPVSIDRKARRISLACFAGAWAIVGVFFLQSYSDAGRLRLLEERMAVSPRQQEIPRGITRGDVGAVRNLIPQIDRLSDRQQEAAVIELGNAWTLLRSSAPGKRTEMERLQAKYPRLWNLTLDHGLDDSTKSILATEGRAFLLDVQKLVNLGGQ